MLTQSKLKTEQHVDASPILKWAGGKTQLLPILRNNYPEDLKNGRIKTYIEPFLGGGAVYFDLFNNYNFEQAYLFDINPELITLYNTIKKQSSSIIEELSNLEKQYLSIKSEEERKLFFYKIRDIYNNSVNTTVSAKDCEKSNPKRSAMTVFLNRTCFNGLFRVNSKGQFNVPHGKYKNPAILFEEKILAASQAFQKAEIKLCDFSECSKYASGNTFIYYDPPYRPVSKTASFTSYSKESFDDREQKRLATLYKELHQQDVFQLLSNSDPTNYIDDPFFDNLYNGFNIQRVKAKRLINSDSSKRDELNEILVRNY